MIKSVDKYFDSDEYNTLETDNSQTALEWCGVLASQNIDFILQRVSDDIWIFIIEEKDFQTANENITAYESERSFFRRFRELYDAEPQPLRIKQAIPALIFSIAVGLFYYITGPASSKSIWQSRGMLSAKFFSDKEWWTPVTALSLHADLPHLIGNMTFFVVLGTAVALETGAGTMLLLTILSGILGNLSTLYLFGSYVYNAIGFSTALFALPGMLAVMALIRNFSIKTLLSLPFWMPLVAAFAFLGLTGGAAGSDLSGHLFGFLWGAFFGFAAHLLAPWRKNRLFQTAMYITACLILAGAWYLAMNLNG